MSPTAAVVVGEQFKLRLISQLLTDTHSQREVGVNIGKLQKWSNTAPPPNLTSESCEGESFYM